MVLDIFKILTEEDNKIRKFVSVVAKGALLVLVTAEAYVRAIGPYKLIDVFSIKDWSDYITSGRILLCLFLLVVVHFILFHLLKQFTLIPILIATYLGRKFKLDRDASKSIPSLLNFFELIKVEKNKDRVSFGRNTPQFYAFIQSFNKKNAAGNVQQMKDNFIEDVWHPYALFTAYYFLYHKDAMPNSFITNCVIIGAAGLIFVYAALSVFSEFLLNQSSDLLFGIRALMFQETAIRTIKNDSGFIYQSNEPGLKYDHYFFGRKKKYLIHCHYDKRPIRERNIEKLKELLAEDDMHILLLSNQPATNQALEKQDWSKIKLVQADDEKDLSKKLRIFLKEEYINE